MCFASERTRKLHGRRLGAGLRYVLLALMVGIGVFQPCAAKLDMDALIELVEDGQARAAYAQALPYREEHEGDPKFDFYYGVAAIDTGYVSEGVFALERALLFYPDEDRVRLELARGYFFLEEDERARQEFEAVLSRDPPAGVQATVKRFLDRIEAREGRYRTAYSGYAELGLGYDSNINSAPQQLEIFSGRAISEDSLEQADGFASLALGGEVRHPLKPGITAYLQADASQRFNQDGNVDTGALSGQAGITLLRGVHRYRTSVQVQRFYLDNAAYRDLLGIGGEWRRLLTSRTQLTAFAQWADLEYPDQAIRDSNLVTLGIGGVHTLSARFRPDVFGSLFAGHDEADEDSDQAEAVAERDFFGLRIGIQMTVDPAVSTRASVLAQNSHYGAEDGFFGKTRNDHYYALAVGATWSLKKELSLLADLSHAINNSNIDVHEYDRTLAELALRYDFR